MQQGDWIIVSPDIRMPTDYRGFEGDAKMRAEQLARNHRGVRFFIAQIMASVQEPLPDLQWSDGRPAGSGADGPQILTGSAPQSAYGDTYGLGANQAKAVNRRE